MEHWLKWLLVAVAIFLLLAWMRSKRLESQTPQAYDEEVELSGSPAPVAEGFETYWAPSYENKYCPDCNLGGFRSQRDCNNCNNCQWVIGADGNGRCLNSGYPSAVYDYNVDYVPNYWWNSWWPSNWYGNYWGANRLGNYGYGGRYGWNSGNRDWSGHGSNSGWSGRGDGGRGDGGHGSRGSGSGSRGSGGRGSGGRGSGGRGSGGRR